MTKKLVLLACIVALAVGASAQSSTTMFKGPWKNAPKSHAVGSSIKAGAVASSVGATSPKVGPSAPLVGPNAHRFSAGSAASPADVTYKIRANAIPGSSGRGGRK
jgi:hypothetical protein